MSRLAWTLAVSSAALFAPLAWPLVTGRVFIDGDLKGLHLPLRHLYQNALLAGDSFLWTPSIFSGLYIHGDGQAGMYHPLHLLLYRVLPLGVAFDLELIVTYAAAFTGMFLWLERVGIERRAAVFGAILLAFSGFNLWHYQHLNLVAVVAHLPWLLLATDVLLTARTRASLAAGYAGVSSVFASAVLLGAPQGVWFIVLAGSVFVAYEMRRAHLARLLWLGSAVLTGVFIAGIQLLPTLDVLRRSIRPLLERDFALTFSLHPINLLQLWSPDVFLNHVYTATDPPFIHEFTIYSGAFLLVSLPWLWIRRHELRARRPVLLPALALAALALVLALGRYGGLTVALTYVPLIGSFRAPARYIALVQFSLITLAAVAFDDLVSVQRAGPLIPWKRLWPLLIPATLSVATTALLNWRLLPVLHLIPFSPARVAVRGSLLFLLVTALVVLAARHVRWALPALVVITAVDIGLWGYPEVFRTPPQPIPVLVDGVEPPSRESGGEYIFVSHPQLDANLLSLAGYRLASGYMGLPPMTYFHYSSSISRQLSGAHWEYTPKGKERYAGAVDRARMLAESRVTNQFGLDWDKVDLHTSALLDRDVGPLVGPPGSAQVVIDRPGHIVVDVEAPGRQLLALTERYHDGWRAATGGSPLQMVAIHGDFLGCVVNGGSTRVDLRFEPASFATGRIITALGLLLFGVSMAVIRRSGAAP